MRCSKAREYLNRELDEQLPPDATGDLRDHLDACGECREFRADLLLSRRLLAASEPVLPDNFDWKLQLRLNQALRERAGETAYPWDEARTDRWFWLRNFGAATAVGMAAVLALAMFLGPVDLASRADGSGRTPAGTARTAGQTDRSALTLDNRAVSFNRPGIGTPVSGASQRFSPGGTGFDRGWSGDRMEDLRTIQRLRVNNQRLARVMLSYQKEIARLQAQLDTTAVQPLDLQESQ